MRVHLDEVWRECLTVTGAIPAIWHSLPEHREGGTAPRSWDQPDGPSVEFIKLALQVGEMLRFGLLPRPALRLRLSLPDELKSVGVIGGFD